VRVVIIGDSNIGDSADGRGTLGQALAELFRDEHQAEVTVVGVRSSTAGQWAVRRTYHPEGLAKDTRKGRGVFRPFSRLSSTQRSRTQLSALRALNPDLVVINFASNDSAGYGKANPQAFVENAQYLTNYFNKPVIWFDGGFATATEPRKRPMVNYAKPILSSRKFLFIDSGTAARRQPFIEVGARSHPRVSAWRKYLSLPSVRSEMNSFIRRVKRPVPWVALAATAAGIVTGIFLFG